MLYQPNVVEIFPLIQKAISQWPHLVDRARSAEAILLNSDFRYRNLAWEVKSQSADQWYRIVWDGTEASCNCKDFVKGGVRAAGRKFCKHTIAWLAYKDILTKRMNHHLQIGTFQIERLLIDYYLVGDIDTILIAQDGDWAWWKFVTAASMYAFAGWLGHQQAIGAEPHAVAPKRERTRIEVFDYPIRGHIDAACMDATCMSYDEWIGAHGSSLAIGLDESRRPYAY